MKRNFVSTLILSGILFVACNRLRITAITEIDIAGKGNYNINDIAVVSGNRGPIRISGERSSDREYVYMTGSYRGADGTTRCLTAKYTEQGKPIWYRLYPEQDTGGDRSAASIGLSLQVSTDGVLKEQIVYVLAEEYVGNDKHHMVLIKYDSLGNRIFDKIIIESKDVFSASIISDFAGNLYWAGHVVKTDGFFEIFLCKYDTQGELIWSNSYLNPELNCRQVKFHMWDPDRLICSGALLDRKDLFYITFDSLGNALDVVVCTTPEQEVALVDIMVGEDGAIYLVGNYTAGNGGTNFSTMVYDRMNNIRWRAVFNNSAGEHVMAHALSIDDSGCMYVAGSIRGQQGQYYLSLVKYDTTGVKIWGKSEDSIPGAPLEPWFISPEFIHNRFQYRSASNIDIIVGTSDGVFIARYNTVGFRKAIALYRIKNRESRVYAVDEKWIGVNVFPGSLPCSPISTGQAMFLKYEEFEILGINRWD